MQEVRRDFSLAAARAGSSNAAKMAMMAITTSSSISVNALNSLRITPSPAFFNLRNITVSPEKVLELPTVRPPPSNHLLSGKHCAAASRLHAESHPVIASLRACALCGPPDMINVMVAP
jgi:hypothetical protein